MELEKAISIIKALSDGIDPHSGEHYPSDSPYQTPDTVRALTAAVIALEKQQKVIARQKKLPTGAGRPWNKEEDEMLISTYYKSAPIMELSKLHNRTEGAIRSRLLLHGMIIK